MKRKYYRLETSEFNICLTNAYGYGESGTPNGNSYGFRRWVGDGDGLYYWDRAGNGYGDGYEYGNRDADGFGTGLSSFIIEEDEEE